MDNFFSKLADFVVRAAGRPAAFVGAFLLVLVWGAVGPLCGFSDLWQLVINTGTTIITFLMVFLIQNSRSAGRHHPGRRSFLKSSPDDCCPGR